MSFDTDGKWPMTHDQTMEKILQNLPEEFQAYVRSVAYERGHSAGPSEIENITEGMAFELQKVIEVYDKRVKDRAQEDKDALINDHLKQEVKLKERITFLLGALGGCVTAEGAYAFVPCSTSELVRRITAINKIARSAIK